MKVIKIVLALLLAVVIVVLALGLIVPSYEYESSIQVKASPEKCWRIFHNTRLMAQWLEGFESLTLKSGDTLGIGSTYEIVINDHDKRMVMSEKITEMDAPTKIKYQLDNDVLKSEFTFSFEGDSTTTAITNHYKVTGNNVIWKSILFLSKSYMAGASQDQLKLLKGVIEKQP
ncbi:MAG: SRPBCC family protein [Cyclobacteriaceae bacterium]